MVLMDDYKQVMEQGEDFKKKLVELEVIEKQNERTLERLNKELEELEKEAVVLDKVMRLSQTIKEDTQRSAEELLERVLNNALSRVDLDSSYSAKLVHPNTSRAVKGLLIKLEDMKTGKERVPFESTGTMVAQLISFLMSAIVLKMSGKRRIMVVDEVLSGFNDVHSIKEFGDVLVALSQNDGFQIIAVEHKSQLEQVEGINVMHFEKDDEGLKLSELYKV